MEHELVLVTVSYRLGAFGFVSTEDHIIPGNNGLKDQNLALKWIKKNIHLFNGDNQKVTIFGQSAGGASVIYHILSKQSKGLFRAAIAQSGSALCPWSYQPHARNISLQIAKHLGLSFRNTNELLYLLQNVSVKEIEAASKIKFAGIDDNIIFQGSYFAPIVEADRPEAFITLPSYEALKKGDFNRVPLLTGIVEEENLYRAYNMDSLKQLVKVFDDNIIRLVPEGLHIKNLSKKLEVAQKIKQIYLDSGDFKDNLPAAIKYFSDTSNARSGIKNAELHSKFADVYFYQFSYRSLRDPLNINLTGLGKVGHSEDNQYLWLKNNMQLNTNQKDKEIIYLYVKIFADFCKTMKPGLNNWTKISNGNFNFLNIDFRTVRSFEGSKERHLF